MAIELPPLPFGEGDLEPFMSAETLKFHYGKHHKNYVDTTNKLIQGTKYEEMTLEEIVLSARSKDLKIFNNAAQAWNHNFFWNCLRAPGSSSIGSVDNVLAEEFGSVENFKEQFSKTAKEVFGSGWAWLVKNPRGHLQIIGLSNAENPLSESYVPLLTCDVWEHAYYIDCRNDRAKFLENFWNIVNWEFVEENLDKVAGAFAQRRSSTAEIQRHH